jgi:alginate lyase
MESNRRDRRERRSCLLWRLCGLCALGASLTLVAADANPRVFLLDPAQMAAVRARVAGGDAELTPAVSALERDAKAALGAGPFTVASKAVTPPSGDKHDYMSQAPYFWPDPSKPDGRPYIRRDGERNPEIDRITDHRELDRMASAVEALALAYYFEGRESAGSLADSRPPSVYAARAAVLLRAWFVDPPTRMNPNQQFGQGIPGITNGRGIGLIETRGLTRVVDAIGLLAGSRAWTADDDRAVRSWFEQFVAWMRESKNGRDEAAAKNNHGTYYDLQLVSFSLFLGRTDVARQLLEASRAKRIAAQIEPDGRQPLELARTKGWSYSAGNLDGLTQLAVLGERVGVDLWDYQTTDGRSIRRAIDFLIPFALGDRKWPYQQIGEWPAGTLFPVMRRAARHYQDPAYRAAMARVPTLAPADRARLR